MDLKEIEAQCMALSNRIDTEVVEGDPLDLSSFASSTLYVWMVPANSGGNDPEREGRGEAPQMVVRARLGDKLTTGRSVLEVAEKFGITRREASAQSQAAR